MQEEQHRVLVVDDEPDVRLVLSSLLSLEDFTVRCAADGTEAIDEARSFEPHVVLMDVMMPGIGGLEATREIRRGAPDLPIVLLSARTSGADQELGRAAGAVDFITKPFEPADLVERLKAAISAA
jgi:two-component system OmpR family response regulator